MISLNQARTELLASCPRLSAGDVALADALGCVLATDVVASGDIPPFAASAMDGYAVRSDDTSGATHDNPVTLEVLGSVPAGRTASGPVTPGSTWKVMTGAPVPEGADAVVMVENTSATPEHPLSEPGARVLILAPVAPGTAVRDAGSNVSAGATLVADGTPLGPAHLAVLASAGIRRVSVVPRPRVGVLVTGDELVTEERDLRPGEIYESNGPLIEALLATSGCTAVRLGVTGDDPAEVADQLVAAAGRCDAIITTGGVSMGDADPVKAALDRLGRLHALQVAIRPAKPFAYGLLDGPDRPVPLFGLPGNPVSSLVSFELLARPALRTMAGHRRPYRLQVRALADTPMRAPGTDGRTTYLRVSGHFDADGRWHVSPVGAQESHQLAASAHADGLAELAPGASIPAGGEVTVHSLRWDP